MASPEHAVTLKRDGGAKEPGRQSRQGIGCLGEAGLTTRGGQHARRDPQEPSVCRCFRLRSHPFLPRYLSEWQADNCALSNERVEDYRKGPLSCVLSAGKPRWSVIPTFSSRSDSTRAWWLRSLRRSARANWRLGRKHEMPDGGLMKPSTVPRCNRSNGCAFKHCTNQSHGADTQMYAGALRRIQAPAGIGDCDASEHKHPKKPDLEPAEPAEAELVRDIAPPRT